MPNAIERPRTVEGLLRLIGQITMAERRRKWRKVAGFLEFRWECDLVFTKEIEKLRKVVREPIAD